MATDMNTDEGTDGDVTYLVPPNYLPCFITGKLRRDRPEEHVRQRWARSLVEEYGYPKSDIGIEVPIKFGSKRGHSDLAIFRPNAKHVQDEAYIIIEAKKVDVKPSDIKDGEAQLKSYMAASPVCRYGLWVGSERRAFERDPSIGEIERIGDIPRFGAQQASLPIRNDLVPTHELKSAFRRCHNYIYANAGLQKAEAFHELLKLIFCKMFDEEEGDDELQFAIHPGERLSESGQRRLMEERLVPLFERIIDRYPFIFDSNERIMLEPRVAAYIVSELQLISLARTPTDVKGAAYEELVGENLRGDRGEFFTPRNVCDMVVQMVISLHTVNDLTSLRVMDCCAGTGGFLVSWLNNLRSMLLRQETARQHDSVSRESIGWIVRQRIRESASRNVFGLDINPFLVSTCQMNLVLHGDGATNVFRVNSAQSPGEWDDGKARHAVPYGEADIVFTNPPFGGQAKVDDPHILDQYELSRWDTKNSRKTMPAERLFVEASMKFVKPGGYLAIVLPDGILNNPSLRYLRSWILKRSRIIASIDLPKTTFKASKGINNPSVLILRKLTQEEASRADAGVLETAYQVFMAAPRTAGLDNRAKPVYQRHPDGLIKVDDFGQGVIDDEIDAVHAAFREWLLLHPGVK